MLKQITVQLEKEAILKFQITKKFDINFSYK